MRSASAGHRARTPRAPSAVDCYTRGLARRESQERGAHGTAECCTSEQSRRRTERLPACQAFKSPCARKEPTHILRWRICARALLRAARSTSPRASRPVCEAATKDEQKAGGGAWRPDHTPSITVPQGAVLQDCVQAPVQFVPPYSVRGCTQQCTRSD